MRKAKTKEEAATDSITVWMTPGEYAAVVKAAGTDGRSYSAWIRRAVQNALKKTASREP